MVNKVILIGNVGADPEIRSLGNDQRVARLRIATSERWKDRNSGERKERTEWHTVSVFNQGLVGVIERFVKKGSKLYIEGKLETRDWEDKESGAKRYATEIVLRNYGGEITLLDSRGSDDNSSPRPRQNASVQSPGRQNKQDSLPDEFSNADDFYNPDDSQEIPF